MMTIRETKQEAFHFGGALFDYAFNCFPIIGAAERYFALVGEFRKLGLYA